MIKQIKILALLFSIVNYAFTQNCDIDKLLSQANKLIYNNQNEATVYLDSCKTLLKQSPDKYNTAKIYITEARLEISSQNYKRAKYILTKTIKDLEFKKDSLNLSNALYLLSLVNFYETDYTISIKNALKAQQYFKQVGNKRMETKSNNLIGSVFFELEQYYLALEFFNEVKAYALQNKNDTILLTAYNNLGNLYLKGKNKNIKKAIDNYNMALGLAKTLNDPNSTTIKTNLGFSHYEAGDHKTAYKLLLESLEETKQENKYASSKIHFHLGLIETQFNNKDQAEIHFKKSASITKNANNIYLLKDIYSKLAKLKKEEGNYKEALRYTEITYALNDSINLKNEIKAISALTDEQNPGETEITRLKNEIEALNKEKIRGITYRKTGMSVGILLIITTIILYYRYQRLQKRTINFLSGINSDLNKKNIQLSKTVKTRDKLISTIAHDIKNPLGTILGFAELLIQSNKELNKEKILTFSKHIHKSTSNLYILLENLVNWAKTQNQQISTKPITINIAKTIQIQFNILSEMANEKNILLINNCTPEHNVYADMQTLSSAIRNLINNAIKFSPKGGRVEISSELKNKQIYLHIKDSGIGINQKDLPLLFDPEIDKSEIGNGKHHEKGTGLGLTLAKEFIVLNNGKVDVSSEENKGTCFTICLPSTNSKIA